MSLVGDVAWSDAAKAAASDGSIAEATLLPGQTSDRVKVENFGTRLPVSAFIGGLAIVGFAANSDPTNTIRLWVRPVLPSGTAGSWASVDIAEIGVTDYIVGADGDLWGLDDIITKGDTDEKLFGLEFYAENDSGSAADSKVSVDGFRLIVYYNRRKTLSMLGANE